MTANGRREQPTVCVREVNHYYGTGETRKQVLFDNTLDLLPGEIAIMTGPSGSGKTTLLTVIGALRSVQEGSVQVQGRELSGLDNRALVAVRRNIGFIFQAHNLFESLSALQNVMMALALHPYTRQERQARATDMLVRLGLESRLHYKPHALSGGQRQRVAIARALGHRPKLILADEPTAALDKDTGREVVTLLQQLAREEHATIFIVTHDHRILDIADRLVNLVDGRIISNVAVRESVAICEFLLQCPVFATLTPGTLTTVADKMVREQYAAGAVIIRQGDEGDKFYLIHQGTVDVMREDGTTRHLVNTQGPGEFFGERALLTGEPRSATVQARGEVELYTLGKDDFQAALHTSPSLRDQLMRVFFQRQ
jgi:putative ABC transport system ATP-binding protein